jgi:hypothetical protein
MTRLTVDPALQKALEKAVGPVQVYSNEGTVLGYFVPSSISLLGSLTEWELSPDELARRKREGGFVLSKELLQRLESR